jgi:peptidoglycan/xylan/chitin deacetylase (PgdA/CDA1 family)
MTQLSVIIQTKRWSEALRATLVSLVNQTLDCHDFEVIIAAHNADGLEAGLAQMTLPYAYRVILPQGNGPGVIINRAVEAAEGQFCLFLKEYQSATPRLLAEHLQVQLTAVKVVGIGRVIYTPGRGSSWFAKQSCSWQNGQADAWVNGESTLNWINCLNDNFCASRQAILATPPQSQYLDSEWVEGAAEIEMAFQLVKHGFNCAYIPGAVCNCEENRGFTALVKETVQRGAAYVNLWHRLPAMLPELLGNFYDTSLRGIVLRRFLLWLKLSPIFLAVFGPLFQDKSLGSEWIKFLQSYCFWYGVKLALPDRTTWRGLTYGTPILMYHAFSNAGESASRYILPQRRFVQQMALLKFLGYRTISLEEYLEYLTTYRLAPAHSLVITMDDGYQDNFELALPVLRRYGLTATIFIVNDSLGGCNNWDEGSSLTGRPVMNASQVHELQITGISLGSHTCSHPTLTEISPDQSWEEINRSKVDLEQEFGTPVKTFAYPHGNYNSSILEQVKRAGYLGACSVQRGLNTPAALRYALFRTDIFGTTSLLQFLFSVWSG